MRTKVIRTGNSRAVLIPASISTSEAQDWNIGDEVEIESIPSGLHIRRKPRRSVLTIAKRVMKRNEAMLHALAKR
jgi:antitoxin component of MazEF toxin-antitoxin module